MPTPILYDCDPGHDDAIALVMAHRSPDIELLGVTTTCGNAELEKTTDNAIRVLDFVGASDVPVAAGCARPLARPLVLGTADGPSGLEGSPYLPKPSRGPLKQHAVDFLAEKLAASPDPLLVVATGPLCNIGLLVLKHPHVLPKVKELIWMGGVFYRKSEIITPTEFNAFCDPEALKLVLDARVPITMIGLDVTMQVLIEAPQYKELAAIDTPLGRVAMDWLKFYEKLHRNSMGVGGAMHDPLALALAIDPTLVRTRPAHIGVDLSGSYTFGATVADFWHDRGEEDNARIAYDVDADRFFKLMFDLLR
ncbi:nucleoside hydrolase [Mesorhizobium sp. M0830]|uniref:nucleoside hydrolase n=1 Tax=Mesorhizobium sp. M0830 TaxID=2957008 RepID=UPI003336682E